MGLAAAKGEKRALMLFKLLKIYQGFRAAFFVLLTHSRSLRHKKSRSALRSCSITAPTEILKKMLYDNYMISKPLFTRKYGFIRVYGAFPF